CNSRAIRVQFACNSRAIRVQFAKERAPLNLSNEFVKLANRNAVQLAGRKAGSSRLWNPET
ncbi:MAG TPA: hypothetical protein PLP98_10025, partial [Plasticicumulans sp.]|nr:hypothetical protein [Plasticicumulans sp.]